MGAVYQRPGHRRLILLALTYPPRLQPAELQLVLDSHRANITHTPRLQPAAFHLVLDSHRANTALAPPLTFLPFDLPFGVSNIILSILIVEFIQK